MFALIKSKNLQHLSNVKNPQFFRAIANLFLILTPTDATFFKFQKKVQEFL